MTAVAVLTVVHVALSVVGIAAGFVVLGGLIGRRRVEGWTAVFLATTIATNASGFLFPVDRLTPAHVFGVVSLVALGLAVVARYPLQLAGGWRPTYVVSATIAQYLNFFVLIVQLFLKVPALKALAPTQTEPIFAVVQLATLAAFAALGTFAALRFRNQSPVTLKDGRMDGPVSAAAGK